MVADLNKLVRLTKSQIKPAAEMVARAFQDDPLFAYFISDALERKNKLHHLFERLIRYGVLYGEVYAISPNLEGFFNYAFEVHNRHAPFPHWYGGLIGVDPKFQGRGYASALMKPILARIDQEHLPCYIETENKKNVSIFQKYGFEVVEVDTIPGTNINNWAMLREKSA